ncbi:hypothetical protein Ocin01_20209 [Orchesella cincta]|uniref:DUF4789 domain-containing protein n=1 Tax=Orchesella cincta TaxID=48709 RepID=A0A1D2M0I5_ORCCI|nr:hypothetical protein Ocin01_20209 [Orchesella cincta]
MMIEIQRHCMSFIQSVQPHSTNTNAGIQKQKYFLRNRIFNSTQQNLILAQVTLIMSNTCKWISFGVSLVFLYHLSQENNSKCPNEGELMQNDTGECFKRETKGPCFNNLVFVEDKPRSPYGACSCPYMEFNRTIIYYEGQCYFVFSQAYCNEGYWLNVTTHGEPFVN